jgi:hypothetical protein
VPGLTRVVGAGGVGRVFSMPSEEPPSEFLDEAVMGGVSRDQARSTWAHYFGAGLPERGVERLHPWLVKRAKERVTQQTGVVSAAKTKSASAQPNAGKTGWE